MKKRVFKIVFAFAFTALALSGGAGLTLTFANAQNGESTTTQNVETSTEQYTLIAPKTYEEYLPLTSPTGAAVCEEYTAIAEGNVIYYYNREEEEYFSYVHSAQGLPQDTVKNLQFCENGNLYFADNSSGDNFYELDLKTLTKTKLDDIACESFVIHGRDLYFASAVGTLYTVSLEDSASPKKPLLQGEDESQNPSKPILAFWNGELYFTDDGIRQSLYKIKPNVGIPTTVAELSIRIKYMTINAGILACTTSAGDFYTFTLPTLTDEGELTHVPTDGYTSLSSFGEYIYATQTEKGSVRQYSTTEKAFTDFSICAASSKQNRLRGATKTFLTGNTLLIADNGNSRVSVYNVESNSFQTPLSILFSPDFLSSDGNTVLIANKTQAAIYSLKNPSDEPLVLFNDFDGEIKGAASVYGKYYLLSAGRAYCIEKEETQTYALTSARKNCASFVAPSLFTADVYGNLYVSTGNFVYAFDEAGFMQSETEGTPFAHNIPANAEAIVIDYERNLYALSQGKLYKNGNAEPLADFTVNPLVYGKEGYVPNVLSFTFSVEENKTYLLCDGTYLAQTTALSLPTVKTIPVGNASKEIFSQNSAEIFVVNLHKNALLVEFDIHNLREANAHLNAEFFPYIAYNRLEYELTALQIGRTGEYAIVAIFDKATHSYSTYVVREEFTSLLPSDAYQTTYSEAERKTGYLTNDLPLYKFPYLTELLVAQEEMKRGASVTLIGEITELDHDYYHVAYQTADGEKMGYVPKAYILLFEGTPQKTENYTQGETESNHDSLWRFGYLILGFSAVCILADYLILRKKKKDGDK